MLTTSTPANLAIASVTAGQPIPDRPGFVRRIPSAVLRFAVRRVVDDDEVQVAWGVSWHPQVFESVADMGADEARKLFDLISHLPECSVISVQGLSELSRDDKARGRIEKNGATPSAVTAAILCAMKHLMITESVLPIRRKPGSDRNFPARRLPEGWTIEVDVKDVALIAEFDESDRDNPLYQSLEANPAIPYGRFLWAALNGNPESISYVEPDTLDDLRIKTPTMCFGSHIVQARKNHALQVMSPAGAIAITRHAIERAAERLHPKSSLARVASWLANALFSGMLYDVTAVVSAQKNRKLHRRIRVLAREENSRVLIFIVAVDREADYLATVYVANPRLDEAIREAMPHLNGIRN